MLTGQRIQERRKQLNLSQEALAAAIGTNQRQISRYENGANDPTGEVLVKIADVMETTVDFLLGRTEYAERPLRGIGDLSEDEHLLVKIYREKPLETRQKALDLMKLL